MSNASDLHITFAGYTIVRVPLEETPGGVTPLYVVHRPDGSVCCDAVNWAQAEAVVTQDQARRGAGG